MKNRLKVLRAERDWSQEDLARQLEARFRALSDRAGDTRARLQMLRETIAWSLEHLSPTEHRLFERVSQFADGFDRAAVEAVCAGEGLEVEDMAASLSRLVEASLVHCVAETSEDEGPRFAVSRTLRDVAGEVGDVLQVVREAGGTAAAGPGTPACCAPGSCP